MARRRIISKQTKQVLGTLFATPDIWWHGYELCKQTGLKSGTLYPILMRLDDQEYLNSEWRVADPPGRPPRHVYRLSKTGIALANSLKTTDRIIPKSLKPVGGVS